MKFGWLVVVSLVLVAAAVMGWQRRAAIALQAALNAEKSAAQALAGVRADHERLLAAQPVAGELERRAAEAEALTQTRAEVAALRAQVERAERAVAEKQSAPTERFGVGRTRVAADWGNAGTATPQAALETALWAGAGGDVDTFAKMVMLIDARTRRAAQALWESVPDAMRASYRTPEQLIAFLSVRDVPLGSAQVRQFDLLDGWQAPAVHMQLLLTGADGTRKYSRLIFMNPGDGWKLVVTDAVVAKYAEMLKQPQQNADRK